MATVTEPETPLPLSESLKDRSRALGLSLLWGGFLLVVLGIWLGLAHDEMSRLPVLALSALGALGLILGAWHLFTLFRSAVSAEQRLYLARQRTMAGLFLAIVGPALVVCCVWLAWSYRLDAFGEAVGAGIFGLIAIAAARNLFASPRPDDTSLFETLRARHLGLSYGLLAFGAAASLIALYFVFQKPGWQWLPEIGGLLLVGGISMGFGLVLLSSGAVNPAASYMRFFLLTYGGLIGLVLALAAALAAWIWRDEVLFGGLAGWQGPNAYRFWLCAYVELAGLALMFGSFLIARPDIRTSAVLRRVLYGYNALFTGLLLLATLIVANIVFFTAVPYSFDWSQGRGLYDLAPSTKNLLNSLRQPTHFYVLVSRGMLFTEIKNLLDNCQAQSAKVQVTYISPDKDFLEYENLAKRFPELPSGQEAMRDPGGRGILVVYGLLPEDVKQSVPHAYLPLRRLAERKQKRVSEDSEPRMTLTTKGEAEVMRELSFLVQGQKKRVIYFLQGNGELDINQSREGWARRSFTESIEKLGAGFLLEKLKRDNYQVQGLSFEAEPPGAKQENMVFVQEKGKDNRKDVPEDADTLVVAGAGASIPAETVDALERFMERGGKMVVLLDVFLDRKEKEFKSSALEPFLARYGVKVGPGLAMRAVDPRSNIPGLSDPRMVLATAPFETKNDVARPFERKVFELDTVRVVRPDSGPGKYKAEVLLQLDRSASIAGKRFLYWEDSSARAVTDTLRYTVELIQNRTINTRLSPDALPVAVTVTDDSRKLRLVVFGDTEFVGNLELATAEQSQTSNYAIFATVLESMGERPSLTGARPKETASYVLNPREINIARLNLLPGWLMIATVMWLGVGIWIARRR